MSRNIWICYRQSDSRDHGKHIYDALKTHFDQKHVFEITDPPDPRIVTPQSSVRRGDTVIFIIGPSWLTASDGSGQSLLNRADDFVAGNLRYSLVQPQVNAILATVDGAKIPDETDLPLNLSTAFKMKPITLTLNDASEADINVLVHAIRNIWAAPSGRSILPFIVVALIMLIALAVVVVTRIPAFENVSQRIGLWIDSLDPSRVATYSDEGWADYNQGDYQNAVAKFLRSTTLQPNYAPPYDGLGWAYYQLKNQNLALQNFDRYVELTNGSAASYRDRGWYYYNIGKYAPAIDDFNHAVPLAPKVADAYYGLGLANDKLNQFPEALDAYQQYLKLASSPDPFVKNRVAELTQKPSYP